MRFLVDANLPRAILPVLQGAGHIVEFAKDAGLGTAPDAQIATRAQSTDAVLVTRDMDFSNTRDYPPHLYSGIIVLRVPDDMIAADIAAVMNRFMVQLPSIGDLAGRLVILEKDRFRIRPGLSPLS